MYFPPVAIRPMFLPTGVEPVNEISAGVGCATKSSPTSKPAPTTTLRTPAGSPASSKIRASSRPPVGLIQAFRVSKPRSEEHTSELQSRPHLVCRLLLEKKKKKQRTSYTVQQDDLHS